MPRTITHDGRRISIPDNAALEDVIDILSRETAPARPLPDLVAPERKLPTIGQTPPISPSMFDDLIPVQQKPEIFDDLIPPPGVALGKPPASTARPAAASAGLPPGFVIQQPTSATGAAGLPPGFVIQQPSPKLIPVDHDPFSQFADAPPAKLPTYTPVDHDPFAQPAPAQQASGPSRRPRVYINGQPPESTGGTGGPGVLHNLAVGAQGVASGIKDTVLAPVDLMAGLQNAIAAGINKVTGTTIPMATPASKMVEQIAEPFTIDEKNMSPGEKLGYDINRFGTQGLGMGAMLAARAPQVAASVTSAPSAGGRMLDALARPYKDAPARTVIGDTIGGAGAGVAVNAADAIPDHPSGGDWIKNTANVVAPLVGGVGANAAQGVVEGIGGMLKNIAKRTFQSPAQEIPLSPSKTPYSQADTDRAAEKLQAGASGSPKVLAQDIRENSAALTDPQSPGATPVTKSALPTTGLLSRDAGLVTMEGGARAKAAPEFVKRDLNTREAAAERVEGLRDPEADLGAVIRLAGAAREEQLAPRRQEIDDVQGVADDLGRWQQEQAAPYGVRGNTHARATASARLDQAIVDDGYVPARTEKNRQFDTAPGRSDQLPANDVFAAIDRLRAGLNPLVPANEQLPGDFVTRLNRLRPRMVDGENVGGPGTASGADLADLRKFVNIAEQRATQGGNFDLSDTLRDLKSAINRTLNNAPGYAEANANYRSFADRYRPSQGDEMAKFTKEIDRSGNTDGFPNRGSTPPSETAGRFLSIPETATTLRRVFDGAPNAAAGNAAVRDYMMSDFAMKSLNPDGTINPIRSANWASHNSAVLSVFPAIEREFGQVTLAARQGRQLSADVQEGLAQARAKLKATEAELDNSAVGTLLREDPRDVANKLLSGQYNAEKKLDEINALVKNDAPAKRGWKAAVAEVLADRVQGSRQVGESPEVQLSRLSKQFKDNEALLAKTFSPEEMNNLRQAHSLLGYFKEAEKRGVAGVDASDKWNIPGWGQLLARHVYGDLKGGGVIKRFKLLLEQLPTSKQNADEIVHMAWFNPDVAAYLLERPVKSASVPAYNINLRRLIAADNGARENAD